MVWGKIAATEANHNVDTAVFSLWDSVFYLTKNLVMGISVVGEEGVVLRCPFLFFVYVCFLFFCLLVCFFDTTRVYCARDKVLHESNYGENFALNSHINRGATNIFFHALHSSCSVYLICSVIGAFD